MSCNGTSFTVVKTSTSSRARTWECYISRPALNRGSWENWFTFRRSSLSFIEVKPQRKDSKFFPLEVDTFRKGLFVHRKNWVTRNLQKKSGVSPVSPLSQNRAKCKNSTKVYATTDTGKVMHYVASASHRQDTKKLTIYESYRPTED